MIKRIINKIKGLFGRNNKVEAVAVQETPKVTTTEKCLCEYCHSELRGKESAKDTNGVMYICCNKCSYVNKVKDNIVLPKDNSEITIAYELFKKAGHTYSSYKVTAEDNYQSFR